MKRILSLILSLCLILGLCACGGSKTGNAGSWQEQYDLGIRYLSEGNYEEAILAFEAAIKIDPKQVDAYISLAEAYVAQGDAEKALVILDQAEEAVGPSALLEDARSAITQTGSSGAAADSIPKEATMPETVRTKKVDMGAGLVQLREYDSADHLIRSTWYADGVMCKVLDYLYPHAYPFLETEYDENGVQTSITHRIYEEGKPSRLLQEVYSRSDDQLDVNYIVSFTYSGTAVDIQWQKSVVGKQSYFASSEHTGAATHTMLAPENYVLTLSVDDTISLAEYDQEATSSIRIAHYNADGTLKRLDEKTP